MPDAHEMLDMGLDELDRTFEDGEVPDIDEMRGRMHGVHYSGRGPFNSLVWKLGSNRSPWRGMTVEEPRGVNHLGYPPFLFEAIEFEVEFERRDGAEDEGHVLFDYSVESNPTVVDRIREHVRRVDDGTYLAAANLRLRNDLKFMYYFGLESADTTRIDVE